jgi:hypothetical protein
MCADEESRRHARARNRSQVRGPWQAQAAMGEQSQDANLPLQACHPSHQDCTSHHHGGLAPLISIALQAHPPIRLPTHLQQAPGLLHNVQHTSLAVTRGSNCTRIDRYFTGEKAGKRTSRHRGTARSTAMRPDATQAASLQLHTTGVGSRTRCYPYSQETTNPCANSLPSCPAGPFPLSSASATVQQSVDTCHKGI